MGERWALQRTVGARWRPGPGAARFASAPCALAAVAAVLALGGCSGTREAEDNAGILGSRTDTLEARLVPVGGSIARGTVRVAQTPKGAQLSVYFYNVAAGTYRVALHADGNCTSPNGLLGRSAVGGARRNAGRSVITFHIGNDGPVSLVQRVAGLASTAPPESPGAAVVIHQGRTGTLEAEPGRPNNRVACGVIGPVLPVSSISSDDRACGHFASWSQRWAFSPTARS